MPRPKRPKTSPASVKAADRLTQMLEMLAGGMTMHEVGQVFGITRQAVFAHVAKHRDRQDARNDDLIQARIERQHSEIRADIARLEGLIEDLKPFLLVTSSGEGGASTHVDTKLLQGLIGASTAKLRGYEREAKLLGLDAAAKTEVSGPDGAPIAAGVFAVPLGTVATETWAAEALAQSAGEEQAAEALLNGPCSQAEG